MNDFKSKLPSLQELTHMAGKLFKDVKHSICEIIDEYKQKHKEEAEPPKTTPDESSAADKHEVNPEVHREHHVDEQKPLKDDTL